MQDWIYHWDNRMQPQHQIDNIKFKKLIEKTKKSLH